MGTPFFEVKDLKVYYTVKKGFFKQKKQYVKAVDGVSFDVGHGEAFGIVGESGCGKSTLGHAIVGLLDVHDGEILMEGQTIAKPGARPSSEFAKSIQIIFQDPYSSLDPRFIIGRSIAEPLVINKVGTPKSRNKRTIQLLEEVGLSADKYNRFPHEFSGGQRQRVGIARALTTEPKLIVCDEPVSALDVSIQAQILNLMQDLQRKHGLSYIFFSHNLGVVEHLCDRIAVMYLGNIVEIAGNEELFNNPLHPYTRALLNAIPLPDPKRRFTKESLKGDVPSPLNPPKGCCFNTRCPNVCDACHGEKPVLKEISPGHKVACCLV